MLDLYKNITAAGLTPNQYFLLVFRLAGIKEKVLFNPEVELRVLRREGFLTDENEPTKKLAQTELFEEIDLPKEDKSMNRLIGKYIGMFPPIRLPSGAMARVSVPQAKEQFNSFFEQFDYSWDTIYKATQNYLNHYREKDWLYMRNSKWFIMKDGESQLALECDAVENEVEQHSSTFEIDI